MTLYLPPSPTDPSSPPLRKETKLHINTKQSSRDTNTWRNPTSLFSPPLSPSTPAYPDRPLSSSINRKKSNQSQQLSWQQTYLDNVDIEKLTLENAKLKRSNRLLKVDREDWLEERIRPLDQHIRDLTAANVRWQRAAKLLQQDLNDSQQQLENWKHQQVTQMPWMGCEYQFLVNMIHQLQTQITGSTTCKEGNNGARISTPTHPSGSMEMVNNISQRHGSPMTTSIHPITSTSGYQKDWNEVSVLVDKVHSLEHDLNTTLQQLTEKQRNEDRLISELQAKNQLIQLLEKDFDELNTQVHSLQYILQQNGVMISQQQIESTLIDHEATITTMDSIMNQDGIEENDDYTTNDTNDDYSMTDNGDDNGNSNNGYSDLEEETPIIETARDVDRLLPGGNNKGCDFDGCQDNPSTFDKLPINLSSDTLITTTSPLAITTTNCKSPTIASLADHRRTSSSGCSSTLTATICRDHTTRRRQTICSPSSSTFSVSFINTQPIYSYASNSTTSGPLPGTWPTISTTKASSPEENLINGIDKEEDALMISSLIMGHEPFAPFVVLTFLLGFFTKMGIKDDWLIPITLLTMCSGYLWCGAFCGIHIKFNF
ncbi:hypothetical protein BC941DRAFT_470615 [Chlamydoabsidia padenii]|nr:hypothetical protein BC941DRAFT_470615 [Chlamydoabsidia padenii]